MSDPYLYEDVPVLKNELGIKNEKTLDRIEAEQSRANMMLLYEQGFQDFSPDGLREIHRTLFADIVRVQHFWQKISRFLAKYFGKSPA